MEILITDIMRPLPVALQEYQSIQYVWILTAKHHLPILPVVNQNQILTGTILVDALKPDLPGCIPVKEVMEKDPIAISSHQGIHTAARVMSNYGMHALIVTNLHKVPLGFITAFDLLKLIDRPVFHAVPWPKRKLKEKHFSNKNILHSLFKRMSLALNG